ncbi:MAG: hypothetical protein HYX61_12800 [Gammaproteobacteria bacterium]|jgi:hypothetical protein|nr:hypothetical protein [Gammaproteobacteria bacterium]
MYILNESEIKQISGGYEQNLADALEVMSILSTASGIAGGIIFGSLYSPSSSIVATVLAESSGLTVVTLPMAIFTGIGIGATIGTVLGAGLYYSGIIFKE